MKDHSSQVRACEEWFNTQKEEIVEFRKTSEQYAEGKINESELNKLIEKTMSRFRDFAEKRSRLAQSDVTPFLAPPWCSSLENSTAWVGGCRPSSFFSLVYGMCGRDIEKQLAQYLQGDRFDFGHLSAEQLEKVDALQRRIVRYENSYSARLAELQNDIWISHWLHSWKRLCQLCLTAGMRIAVNPAAWMQIRLLKNTGGIWLRWWKTLIS